MTYAIWHFAKAAFFRPESPFDWTPAERDLLAAMPLLPRDLVAYQVASVTVTTILKAGLFTVLLLPDLRSLPLGFAGLLLAMLALEMLRMAVDIATWGMGRAAFFVYRTVVVAGLVAAGFAVGTVAVARTCLRADQPRRRAPRSAARYLGPTRTRPSSATSRCRFGRLST